MKPKNTSARATSVTVAALHSSACSRSAPLRRIRPASPLVQLSISRNPSVIISPESTVTGIRVIRGPPNASASASTETEMTVVRAGAAARVPARQRDRARQHDGKTAAEAGQDVGEAVRDDLALCLVAAVGDVVDRDRGEQSVQRADEGDQSGRRDDELGVFLDRAPGRVRERQQRGRNGQNPGGRADDGPQAHRRKDERDRVVQQRSRDEPDQRRRHSPPFCGDRRDRQPPSRGRRSASPARARSKRRRVRTRNPPCVRPASGATCAMMISADAPHMNPATNG